MKNKFLNILLLVLILIGIAGCGKTEQELKDEESLKIINKYVSFIEKEEQSVGKTKSLFLDINNDQKIEMLLSYNKDDTNYVTVLYLNDDNEVVNPGYLKGVSSYAVATQNIDGELNWVFYTGLDMYTNPDNIYYNANDFLKSDFKVEEITPIGNYRVLKENYAFNGTSLSFNDLDKDMLLVDYNNGLNYKDRMNQSVLESQLEELKKVQSNPSELQVGKYKVKYGDYEFYQDGKKTGQFTLNRDGTYIATGERFGGSGGRYIKSMGNYEIATLDVSQDINPEYEEAFCFESTYKGEKINDNINCFPVYDNYKFILGVNEEVKYLG